MAKIVLVDSPVPRSKSEGSIVLLLEVLLILRAINLISLLQEGCVFNKKSFPKNRAKSFNRLSSVWPGERFWVWQITSCFRFQSGLGDIDLIVSLGELKGSIRPGGPELAFADNSQQQIPITRIAILFTLPE